MKTIKYLLLTFMSILLLSCSKKSCSCSKNDDENPNSTRNLAVEIVLTQGMASYMKIVPADKSNLYEDKDVKEYNNVSQANFVLPNYSTHFYLTIQGNQKNLVGYVKINGIKSKIIIIDWYQQSTYYLDDYFK